MRQGHLKIAALCLLASLAAFHVAEAVLFTAGGLIIDTSIAIAVFQKFLALPLLLTGKRSVDSQFQTAARPEEYLAVATSMDSDKCIPVIICAAIARSRVNGGEQMLTKFDSLVVHSFEQNIQDLAANNPSEYEQPSPLAYYLEAAKIGRVARVVDACREVSPSCKYTLEDLRRVTNSVTEYNI